MTDRSVRVTFDAIITRYRAGVATMIADTKKLGGVVTTAAASNKTAFTAMGLGASVAGGLVVRGFLDDAEAARKFQAELVKTQGLAGASAEEMAMLGNAALQMGFTGKGPQELAEAMYFVVSAGFTAGEALGIVEQSAKAASAGLGTTAEVADVVTSAMNAYGPGALSAAAATDILVNTVREGKAEADEVAGAMGRVIPIAAELGVEFHEVGAAMAVMTRTGTSAETSAVNLRGILGQFLKPTSQARQEMDRLGLSAEGLRDSISNNLLGGLLELRKAIGDDHDALGKIIEDQRALTGFLAITGKSVDENATVFEALADSYGLTEEAFQLWADTAEATHARYNAAVEAAKIKSGEAIQPIITMFLEFAARVAGAFVDMPAALRTVVVLATGLGGTLLFVAGVGLLFVSRLADIRTGLKLMQPVLEAVTARFHAGGNAALVFAAKLEAARAASLGANIALTGLGVGVAALVGWQVGSWVEKNLVTPIIMASEEGNRLAETLANLLGPGIIAGLGRLSAGEGIWDSFFPSGKHVTTAEQLEKDLDAVGKRAGWTEKEFTGVNVALKKMQAEGLLTEEAMENIMSTAGLVAIRNAIENGGDLEAVLRALAAGGGVAADGVGEATDEIEALTDAAKGAWEQMFQLAFGFEKLSDSMGGVTPADEIKDLNDELEEARSNLTDLRKKRLENASYIIRTPERERELREIDRDIAEAEAKIDELGAKRAEAKKGPLAILQESTRGNLEVLEQFDKDLRFLVDAGEAELAEGLRQMGPEGAAAAREAVVAVKSGKGLGSLPDHIKEVLRITAELSRARFSDMFAEWPAIAEQEGKTDAEAYQQGWDKSMLDWIPKGPGITALEDGSGYVGADGRVYPRPNSSAAAGGGSVPLGPPLPKSAAAGGGTTPLGPPLPNAVQGQGITYAGAGVTPQAQPASFTNTRQTYIQTGPVMPHNYSEFKRDMEREEQMSSLVEA